MNGRLRQLSEINGNCVQSSLANYQAQPFGHSDRRQAALVDTLRPSGSGGRLPFTLGLTHRVVNNVFTIKRSNTW